MKVESTNVMLEQARPVHDALSRRCAELRIALWLCDAEGKIAVEPQPASPQIRERIQILTSSDWKIGANLSPVRVDSDRWLVPLEDKRGSRRMALNVAAIDVPRNDDGELGRICKVLRWSYDELVRAEHDGRTIEQFSEKLSQAYEETNLLYRMARLLNCASDPVQSVESIGAQLQQVLPFGWLAIRFGSDCRDVRELAGKTTIAGKPPCDAELIKAHCDAMLKRAGEAEWTKLLDPRQHPLAAATGAEVLVEPITHDQRVIGMLLAGNKGGPEPELSSFEIQFLDATADFLGVFHENLARFAEQQEIFIGTVGALTASIDAKDRYTRGHSERVGLMASRMAAAMGMEKALVEQYRIAGLVHDVGKIGVSEAVLTKPGRLTDEEFAQIKLHPGIGFNILKDIRAFEPVLPGVLSHHERWDGRGYPNGVAGENIPLIARVLALADTFDAMSSNRAYRPALPRAKVLDEIRRCGGTQFDPSLAPKFVELDFSEFDQALEKHRDLEHRAA